MAKMRSLLLSSVNVAAAEANCGRGDRRARSRGWFRAAVLFGLPWRHPFLCTGEGGVRLVKHFNTCEYDKVWGRIGSDPNSWFQRSHLGADEEGRRPWCISCC